VRLRRPIVATFAVPPRALWLRFLVPVRGPAIALCGTYSTNFFVRHLKRITLSGSGRGGRPSFPLVRRLALMTRELAAAIAIASERRWNEHRCIGLARGSSRIGSV
jgi:hypothetical protein